MAAFKSVAVFVVLSAFLAISLGQASQGENAEVNGPNPLNPLNWTACDITVIPKISCHDCNTRVICKPIGGLLKTCSNPARPHCNLGICSAVPSADCV